MPISNLQGKTRRPTLIGALTIMLLSACTSIFGPTEAELSAFEEYVYRIDSLQLNEQLNHILNEDKLHNNTRTVVHQYYKGKIDTGQPMLWITRMGVDSDADALLTQLRHEIPLAGLDTAAFHLTEIAQDLNVIHTLAFDSLGIDINTLLPRLDYNLSQAYVCYAIGQRYGFVNPDKLLNQLDFNEELQSYTRLFDYEVKTPDYEEAIRHLTSDERMDYLRQSSPNDSVYLKLQDRLSSSTDVAERHKLAINMERCRWQLKSHKPTNGEHLSTCLPNSYGQCVPIPSSICASASGKKAQRPLCWQATSHASMSIPIGLSRPISSRTKYLFMPAILPILPATATTSST